jgi:hypothetical protein
MIRLLPLVPAAALLVFGGDGLYFAMQGRQLVTIPCDQFARSRQASTRLRVTGCEIDASGIAFRESGGQLEELFLPARPAGNTGPAPIVVATQNPAALGAAQSVFGGGRAANPDRSLAVTQKVIDSLGIRAAIEGVTRAGLVERRRSRRILSGFATPVAPDATILDLGGTPNFMRPGVAVAAGLVLAALPWLLLGRAPSSQERAPQPAPAGSKLGSLVEYEQDEYFPVTHHQDSDRAAGAVVADHAQPVTLPKLLLLNLDVSSGPDAVESAPPLGTRAEVEAILCGVIPDLNVGRTERVLARPDDSVRLDLGAHDPIATAVVEARGAAGVALVKEVLLMTGWRAFAPKTGLFVTPDDLEALGALAVTDTASDE